MLDGRVVRQNATGVTVIERYVAEEGGTLLIPVGGATVADLPADVTRRLDDAGLSYTIERRSAVDDEPDF